MSVSESPVIEGLVLDKRTFTIPRKTPYVLIVAHEGWQHCLTNLTDDEVVERLLRSELGEGE